MRGTIADVPGVKVGNYTDRKKRTGCTVILCENGAVAGMDIRGFAPGTRQTNSLEILHPVSRIDALCIAGGGALGLDAASGVVKFLIENKKGFDIFGKKVPIVPSAVIFDLFFAKENAYPNAEMGYRACQNAGKSTTLEGSVGAGTGATVGKLFGVAQAMKGGLGSLCVKIDNAYLGVLAVVNSFGDVLDENGRILAGARMAEKSKKLSNMQKQISEGVDRKMEGSNTTIIVIATNAGLTKEDATRIAIMAQDGIAKTIAPSHTLFDGDIVFVLSTGNEHASVNVLGCASQELVAKSIRQGIIKADGLGVIPSYNDIKGK
jgi:L-aminopeptidase/D-esterase-like protein